MRNALAVATLALTVGLSAPADAQYRHYYHHGAGGNWAAPLVGGLIVGGMLGALANQPRYYYDAPPVIVEQPRQYCRREVIGYDWYNRPVVDTVCRYQ